MGNRAVIATKDKDIGIYLHWNGSRNSIDAFLAYCKAMKYRSPTEDSYGWARLCQTIANYFGPDGLSIGINVYDHLDTDNYDNGTYIIENWKIVDRLYSRGEDLKTSINDLVAMLKSIRDHQPEHSQLNDDQILIAAKNYLAQYNK